MTDSRRTLAALLPLMLMFPSCGSSKVSQPTANKQVAPSTVDFSQPLVASALRERAIRIIEESAGSEKPSIRANAIEAAGKSAQRFPSADRAWTDGSESGRAGGRRDDYRQEKAR